MRSLLFVLFVCFLHFANATTYYFSAVSGDDSRTSSEARNSSTPWKSLSKLNAIFNSLQPGDAVLLKRDETFYGSIIVNKSGTSGSPITIGAYGSGNKPIITSLVTLTNWVSKGNGIYESYNSSLGATVNTVLLNGTPQELGRFPNSDASNKGYLMFDAVSGTTSITDYDLKSTPNWTGATVVIRSRRYITNLNLITSHSGTKIYYKASTSLTPYNKQGYFITNSIKTLDKFGEWYYNSSSKRLSVYFGSSSPSSHFVQASTISDLISSSKFSNIVFNNLIIKGANASGVNIKFGSNIQVANCDILYSGQYGVMSKFHPNFTLENSTISNSNFGGVNLGYGKDKAIIRNNKIINTNVFAGMGGSGDSKGVGIMSFGDNSIIEYNQIINTGFSGINFNGDNVSIKNNFINNFCMTKDDGAGIYTYTGSINTVHKGRKLIGNIIINGKGAWEGTSLPIYYMANGIYLDTGVSGVEVSDNTIANCISQGIYLHNAHDIIMKHNTVFNSGHRQVALIENANRPKLRNCTVTNSVFFCNSVLQKLISRVSDDNNINLFAKFSGNYYARPLDKNAEDFLQKIQTAEPNAKLLSFVNPVRFEYNGTKAAKTIALDANYVDVKNNKYSGSITLQPFTSAILIKSTGSPTTTGTSPVVSITSPAANTSFNSGENINIKATATDEDGTVSKVEFFNGSTLLNTQQNSPYEYSWQNAPTGNYTITAKATDNSGHTTSKSVSVSVVTTSSYPKVSITSPATNTSFKAGEKIIIKATATDGDGSIRKVEFFNGTTLLNTQQYSPYEYSWQNVPAGNYTITAKATDNSGHTASKSVSVSVTASSYPKVSITSPVSNASYRAGSTITITANASDEGGSIKTVVFYKGTTVLNTQKYAPYRWYWKNVGEGNYTITAKATDNSGHVTTSSNVYIKVVKASNRSSDNNGSLDIVTKNDTANFELATADKVKNSSFDFNLFPNPAVNTIKVSFNNPQFNQKANLSIQTISGSILKNLSVNLSGKTFETDISSLPVGIYTMRLTGNNFNITKKFVKIN